MIQAFRQTHPQMPLRHACQVLGVSRSWLYEACLSPEPPGGRNGDPSEDLALREAIEQLTLQYHGYGYRRITAQLHRDGYAVNHKRVLRLMREECLLCRIKRHFVHTTNSRHGAPVYPNLLKQLVVHGPNQAWVGDITYIRLPSCFCYLAVLVDLYSRYCVGWHLSREIDTGLTLAALEMALDQRTPPAGLVHHSDRGVQYASNAYIERLAGAGVVPSMSAKGCPYDNAWAESFFATLKREEVRPRRYESFADAHANIGPFIEEVYNQKRLHSSLGYVPPAEFEARHVDCMAIKAT